MDAEGPLIEDWGSVAVRLSGEGVTEGPGVVVQPDSLPYRHHGSHGAELRWGPVESKTPFGPKLGTLGGEVG